MDERPPPAQPDPALCPLCGAPSACAMETQRRTGQPQPPCWCTRASFPPALLARVDPAARGQACICAACAAAHAAGQPPGVRPVHSS